MQFLRLVSQINLSNHRNLLFDSEQHYPNVFYSVAFLQYLFLLQPISLLSTSYPEILTVFVMCYYEVYRVAYSGVPRDHHAIFVETHESGKDTGHIFQVTGNIQQGMSFEDKPAKKPEESVSFQEKARIGKVSVENYPKIRGVCQQIPPPEKQFNGPKRIDPSKPLRRCQEWTAQATTGLEKEGVLEK